LVARLLAAALLALMAAGAGLAANKPADKPAGRDLEEVERAIDATRKRDHEIRLRADALKAELRTLRKQSVGIARSIHEHEEKLSLLETKLATVAREEAEKSTTLDHRREQFSKVLMVLERLVRYPPEALIVQPLSPPDMVRSAILLRAAVPRIEEDAGNLRRDLAELARTRADMVRHREQVATATKNLEAERKRLAALSKRTDKLRRSTLSEGRKVARRVEILSREAKDLRKLIEALERERRQREARELKERERREREAAAAVAATAAAAAPPPPPPPPPPKPSFGGLPISKARGMLPFPAMGRIVGRYGQMTETGMSRKGIVIHTRPDAQVVAPYDGRVVFAGPFRGYGQLLIIEHGEGYHSLVAGMARIDGVIGQSVLAGQPVGVMGSQKGGKPALYVELRRKGRPINPLPWLAARKRKVNG
jgi:murein hydrolase activator